LGPPSPALPAAPRRPSSQLVADDLALIPFGTDPRAISSAGRAPPRQGGGHWFEPSIAHSDKRPANPTGFCFFWGVRFRFAGSIGLTLGKHVQRVPAARPRRRRKLIYVPVRGLRREGAREARRLPRGGGNVIPGSLRTAGRPGSSRPCSSHARGTSSRCRCRARAGGYRHDRGRRPIPHGTLFRR
jgi:hypothetical protein